MEFQKVYIYCPCVVNGPIYFPPIGIEIRFYSATQSYSEGKIVPGGDVTAASKALFRGRQR